MFNRVAMRAGELSDDRRPRVIVWRDVLAIGFAVLVAAALGALVILPQVYPKRPTSSELQSCAVVVSWT
jgi:hypothetical protein